MMDVTDKVAVTKKFQELGLEGLPALIYASTDRLTAARLVQDFGDNSRLMIRTASDHEQRNLPRLPGVTAVQAEAWINGLPTELRVIIQPYDAVVFSVELAMYQEGYIAEIVPGIWELATNLTPAVIRHDAGSGYHLEWPTGYQMASFHQLHQGYIPRLARVEDWHVSVLISWLRLHDEALSALRSQMGSGSFGLKLHYAACFGLSPQNLRTSLPPFVPTYQEVAEVVPVLSPDESIPGGAHVMLDVSIAREDHGRLSGLIGRLLDAKVEVVYLKSGLLSHLAVELREAGIKVRRFNGALLRS
jgi:hypothetical protein